MTRLGISLLLLSLAACAGTESVQVQSLQSKDKRLSCKEIQLEINEAQYYRKAAEKNKNPGVSTFLMPLGYISTYMNAGEASKSANARIEYLNRIYDILNCDARANQGYQARPQAYAPAPQAAPSGGNDVYW